jgi:SOS-response transcriptional repressor LexA
MKTLAARVRQVRVERGLSQEALGEKAGWSQNKISRLEIGASISVEPDKLVSLARVLGVSPGWLLDGDAADVGPQASSLQPPAFSVAALLDAACERVKAELAERRVRPIEVTPRWRLAGDTGRLKRKRGEMWDGEFVAVPLLTDRAAAGAPVEIVDEDVEDFCIIEARAIRHPGATRCVRVQGDSMERVLREGSIVAVDHTLRNPEGLHRKIVAARTEDGVTIKWLDVTPAGLVLRPENREHDPIVLRPSDENPIIGQVVWAWSAFQ